VSSLLASVTLPLASEEGETPSVLAVPLDEFILGLVAFAIVLIVMAKVALPSIKKALAERTDAIEGGLERAASAEAEANELLADYKQQVAGAQDEAAAIRAKADSDGKAIVEDAKSKAEMERAAIAQRAEAQLAAERSQTVASLRQDVGGIAVDLAGRIVGATLSDDERANAVVDEFITEMERAADATTAVSSEDS
jgi:F-type H+-transporting ATPase subunit b